MSKTRDFQFQDGQGFWVFGYGSLMWDPGFDFAEKRVGLLRGYHRSFCLYSHRYRGTPEKPGLVLGLDRGGCCRGMVLRLPDHELREQLAKLLPAVASLGVDRLVLLNAARVEKSYFTAGVLEPASVDALLRLGLEQARDTVPPEVLVRPLFRPFVEDECDRLLAGTELRLVAHPPAAAPCPHREDARRVALAIGPEGGWVPFEIELLASRGFRPVSLGPRVLRVETVVPLLVGMLR